jgi:hypothetical protein
METSETRSNAPVATAARDRRDLRSANRARPTHANGNAVVTTAKKGVAFWVAQHISSAELETTQVSELDPPDENPPR